MRNDGDFSQKLISRSVFARQGMVIGLSATNENGNREGEVVLVRVTTNGAIHLGCQNSRLMPFPMPLGGQFSCESDD